MSWLAAGASFLGGLYQNQEAKRSAKRQMEFQASMSNTSYQRAMADMKAAGLNPMLAYKMGGASTPAGAMYNPVNVGMAATDGYLKGEQAQLASAQQGVANTQAALNKEQARKVRTEVQTKIPAEVEKMRQEGLLAQAGISVKEAEAKLKDLSAEMLKMDKDSLESMGLSPMQMQYKPSNQIGSMFINAMVDQFGDNPKLWQMSVDEIVAFIIGE